MKIAIVSDVHLGTRQYGIKERYEDFLASFRRMGNVRDVDAIVIGGDLFDTPRPDAHSVLVAKETVEKMSGQGVHVLGIDGNHDLANGDWLRVIGVQPLDYSEPFYVGGVAICGVNYRNGRDLVATLQDMADRGVKPDVLVMHFALAEMNGGGSADTGVQELSPILDRLGVKAVLMGHVHIPDCRRWNGVLYVNPGSTEMKSSNEPQQKFYYILDTDTWTAEPVPLVTRTVVNVDVPNEDAVLEFQRLLNDEAMRVLDGGQTDRPFYQVVASDAVDDVFKRLSKAIHDTGAIARIVMRSNKARDLAPVVDRTESVATLESAIEARFPRESDEAKLTAAMLHSPEPSSIHLIVEEFMSGKQDKKA